MDITNDPKEMEREIAIWEAIEEVIRAEENYDKWEAIRSLEEVKHKFKPEWIE